jgi:tetratricopeptide (TPR) repeat protein
VRIDGVGAAHLPFTLAGFALEPLGLSEKTALGLWAASAICFGLLMALGLRMLFGINYSKGLLLVAVAALSFSVQAKLFASVSPFLFSPFLLFYGFMMFRGDIGDIGFSLRQRQGFRRSMEAATINPKDASAHYQLGLIYQYRRQYGEAISRFEKAIQIAHDETDAHFNSAASHANKEDCKTRSTISASCSNRTKSIRTARSGARSAQRISQRRCLRRQRRARKIHRSPSLRS